MERRGALGAESSESAAAILGMPAVLILPDRRAEQRGRVERHTTAERRFKTERSE